MERGGGRTDLRKPGVENAEVVIVVGGALGKILDLGFVEKFLALVVSHLAPDGVFLEGLERDGG